MALADSTVFIHATALVDSGAKIGPNTKIWHWTHVCSGAVIGSGCSFGQGVFIGDMVVIGDNVKVQNNVSIYDTVKIEDDVFCGPSMVFTNVINPRSEHPRRNQYSPTLVSRGATLGANCTIVCGTKIGAYAFVGAGAVVTKDVPSFALVLGVPAQQIGWMSAFGERIELPLNGSGVWECGHTGDIYRLEDGQLKRY